ncbi:hypothetical protein BTH_II2076 [Burkholderia thailandensis E264]|uniref:Uncharacterized protein n=1 Tax=Burkholderia thailandensis (strain ATCC 700388 / DSM 13276 / CCUG 48851 / CIP 106301 / E264) TaxID=271848 RepID=Q2T3I5_BURTA|nr:hypothetical protein BTH_II2076 [Burkholderia thailandensis E264]
MRAFAADRDSARCFVRADERGACGRRVCSLSPFRMAKEGG